MNLEQFISYCESKPNVTTEFPFGPDTLVFKVSGKIFAITGLDEPDFHANLKCEPNYALELRDQYQEIIPGYHMNKKHWNTVSFEGRLSDKLLKSLIDHSYELVLPKSTKKAK